MINKLQNISFYILILIVFILLSVLNFNNHFQFDLSQNKRNSITKQSVELLRQFNEPIGISAFVNDDPLLRKLIKLWVGRYQQGKPDINLKWINPETSPSIARENDITKNATLIIKYQDKQQRVEKISENNITNALYKLIADDQKKLIFITGHGERSPIGKANHDWSILTQKLSKIGFVSETRNLFENSIINPKTEVVVLANPLSTLFEQERLIINDFIDAGGNLLITIDPDKKQPLDFLLQKLKVNPLPGVIVDATTQSLGIEQVDFAIVSEYSSHPLTKDFKSLTLFPKAVALDIASDFSLNQKTWDVYPFLSTLKHSWTETSKIAGDIAYTPNTTERAGPLDLALLLSYKEQKIIILGDSDFISNTYLGNGGNLALAFRIVQFLASSNKLININKNAVKDLEFELSEQFKAVVGLGFLVILPCFLLFTGLVIWFRRRKAKS